MEMRQNIISILEPLCVMGFRRLPHGKIAENWNFLNPLILEKRGKLEDFTTPRPLYGTS